MRHALLMALGALPLLAGSTLAAETSSPAPSSGPASPDGPVTEIAIRVLGADQDPAVFAGAREAFVDLLGRQPGVVAEREFQAVLDGGTFAPPVTPVFTGMTQYEDLAAFEAAASAIGASPEAGAFMGTFTPALFTVLRPKDPAASYDLASIAAEPGQVLEVAARDLSQIPDFDPAAYESALHGFLSELARQPGFVAEYQWVSVLDPNLVVGMTVYESTDAFAAIAQDEAFLASAMGFITAYPPIAGYVHVDAGS